MLAAPFTFLPLRRDRLLGESAYNATAQKLRIPSRDKNRKIVAYLHVPPSSSSASALALAKPIVVNWHGSGFIMPLLGSDSLYCAQIAKEAGVFVLDCDYRKAPEHPFPAAPEDVEDVLKWVASQSDRFDTTRVAVSGFSAGANLALVAASVLRKTVEVTIKTAIAIYPVTDISLAPESKKVPAPIKPISPSMARLFNNCYVPDPAMRTDPRVSPSYAKLEDFAPTVVMITCEGDTLSPEADSLAEKLDDGQRKVAHLRLKGVHHGFDKGPKEGSKEWERREEAYKLVVKMVRESLGA
ncbi:alpha/beta-hydrolase [Trematosphaeria pertusa]|uniref:Alpha/beta-hydrolase n=1 Tax=Trematosphaeria pertusa TaxID=390896 RepID=A0A6A6HUE0_9PLEO|nr:alpha/beta-hydrolase [Trematosphaeria pertusa]KAF2241539.1 alpha/beta-hydrolase [Trematosphaeria pertusa]